MATFTSTRKPGSTSAATASKPKLRADAATLKKYGCFLDSGAVLCFCNTEPRVQAIRRVTRKESSPNLGREFWSCGNFVEEQQCGFFLCLGRGLRTPPPADKPALPPLVKPITPATSPHKRPRARSPPALRPSTAAATPAPASSPIKPRQQPVVTDSFDDVDFDSLDAGIDDEIEDDDELVLSPSASPSKKPRFESFGPSSGASRARTATPSTSQQQHWQGAAAAAPTPGKARAGGFDAIRADPDSPFHALHKELFGAGAGGERGPVSSPAPVSPSKAGPAAYEGATSSFDALSAALSSAVEAVELVKKEREKEARLQVAARRKEEVLKKAVERAKEEGEVVKRENERLKERIRMLEEENNELRTR